MNEKALYIYNSTFLVELTKNNSVENTYGFVVNEGTEENPKLIHYIHGDVTNNDISRVRMIFNYYHSDHLMERSVSSNFISQKFTYDAQNKVSIGEFPMNVAGEKIESWF